MMKHDAHDESQRAGVAIACPPTAIDAHVELHDAPSASECARVTALAMALIADSRGWMAAQSPQFRSVPIEALAFLCATVSPWRTPEQLAACMRMQLWICAFDDHIESVTSVGQLDDVLSRCANIVRGNGPDTSHWLLTALSNWQREIASQPLYPVLGGLWVEKFEATLRSLRYEWTAAQSTQRDHSGLHDYLAHPETIGAWIAHIPRWLVYGDSVVLEHLDSLVSSLREQVVAFRLANDLQTFFRERDQPGNDNVLLYGVSADWVKNEIARRCDAAAQPIAALLAVQALPAVELMRELEYQIAFYAVTDFRR